jgi:hypothetical protein
VRVVNVKPAGKLAEPRTAEALAWPGQLIEGHGWQYEIWSGADPVLLANLRFLAGSPSRRPGEVKAAVLRLLWQQRLATDLHGHLGSDSTLEVTA